MFNIRLFWSEFSHSKEVIAIYLIKKKIYMNRMMDNYYLMKRGK